MPLDLRRPETRVATGRNIVAEQRRRVERQRILVAELGARGRHIKVIREGQELLTQMVRNLDMMIENLKRIEAAHEDATSSQLEAAV
jgi:hypothetical protein